ncbi:hypothetical protein B0H34DRAFT_789969 [Crassisporium funariophilum]|nr:hypothetical protein B0H34DRAFT_789969 [Crassisporium funariophilum]
MVSTLGLPGFGLPLNFTPYAPYQQREKTKGKEPNTFRWIMVDYPATGEGRDLFRNALSASEAVEGNFSLPLTTLREFTMLRLMNQLTDKPEWHQKVFNPEIVKKWKNEAIAAREQGVDITIPMVQYCMDELLYKAKLYKENGGLVTVYNGDVIKSDIIVPPTVRAALKAAVAPLENVPEYLKDWHPGSNNQVLDLVHPSLFPLVYGQSRILMDATTSLDVCINKCGAGVTIPIPPKEETLLSLEKYEVHFSPELEDTRPFSRKFQWLPCEVDISGPPESVRITSYINNLHPQIHKGLYNIIEQVITHTIPLWNATLTGLQSDWRKNLGRLAYGRVDYDRSERDFSDSEGPQREDGDDDDDFKARRMNWIKATRIAIQPEADEAFEPPEEPEKPVDLRKDFGHRGLQIIVKLANIHLTPEKPTYKGGSWHVEGQMNEHICATALYYYDNENITDSRIAFRQQSSQEGPDDIYYERQEKAWLTTIFGCVDRGGLVQDVGSVETLEGRLLTFPNILQHQVQSFTLADPSKPGHRKILALFLVDPGIRIISTAHIPCQRRDWWADAVKYGGCLPNLPLEVQDHIFHQMDDFPLTMKVAKDLRLELMEERKVFVVDQTKTYQGGRFSLCEH